MDFEPTESNIDRLSSEAVDNSFSNDKPRTFGTRKDSSFHRSQARPSQLVRGVSISNFLQLGPKLHKHSPSQTMPLEEMHKLYSLSQEAEAKGLTQFLSHTWRSNPYMKYITLLYLHNSRHAYLGAHAVALVTFLILLSLRLGLGYVPPNAMGPLPVTSGDDVPWRTSFICTLAGFISGLLIFLFGHCLRGSAKKELVFFDKICVCQYDEELKNAGIHSFHLVLEQCQSLVILWDEDYFTRLLCTYEVAAFAKLRQGFHNVQVVPLVLGCFAFLTFLIVAFGIFGTVLIHWAMGKLGLVPFVSTWPGFLFVWVWAEKLYVCYLLASGRINMLKQLEHFRVEDAQVFAKEDRNYVNSSIEAWFDDLGSFDHQVRTHLKLAIKDALGPSWCNVPLQAILFENMLAFCGFGYDTLLCCEDFEHFLRCGVLAVGIHFVLNPLYLLGTSAFASWLHRLELRSAWKIMLGMLYCPVAGLWLPVWIFFAWRFPIYITVPALLPGAAVLAAIALRMWWRQAASKEQDAELEFSI